MLESTSFMGVGALWKKMRTMLLCLIRSWNRCCVNSGTCQVRHHFTNVRITAGISNMKKLIHSLSQLEQNHEACRIHKQQKLGKSWQLPCWVVLSITGLLGQPDELWIWRGVRNGVRMTFVSLHHRSCPTPCLRPQLGYPSVLTAETSSYFPLSTPEESKYGQYLLKLASTRWLKQRLPTVLLTLLRGWEGREMSVNNLRLTPLDIQRRKHSKLCTSIGNNRASVRRGYVIFWGANYQRVTQALGSGPLTSGFETAWPMHWCIFSVGSV